MRLKEESANPLTHACEHKFKDCLSAPAGRITTPARNLQGMSDIKDNRTSGAFHDPKIQGIDHQVVVAK